MSRIIDMYPGRRKMPARPAPISAELSLLKSELTRDTRKMIQSLVRVAIGPNLRPWLTSRQVERKLNVSGATLRKLRNEGAIAYCKIGQVIYFDPADVNQALRRRKRKKKV